MTSPLTSGILFALAIGTLVIALSSFTDATRNLAGLFEHLRFLTSNFNRLCKRRQVLRLYRRSAHLSTPAVDVVEIAPGHTL